MGAGGAVDVKGMGDVAWGQASGSALRYVRRSLSAGATCSVLAVALSSSAQSTHGGTAPSQAPAPGGVSPSPAQAGSYAASPLSDRGRAGRVVPPVIDDIEQVCALLTSCDRLPIPASIVPSDFAACVRMLQGQLASPGAVAYSLLVRECGLRANSCAELRACGLRGASSEACTGRGKDAVAGYCDIDGRALRCWHEKVVGVRDCPRGAEQCSVRESQATCSLGPCPKDIAEGAPSVC